jgi:hypothetical protein
VSLTACGGANNGNSAAPPASSSGSSETTALPSNAQPSETPSGGNSTDTPKGAGNLADFLSAYGLTEDDIKPEHFISFGELTMDGDKTKAGERGNMGFITISVDKDATGEEQVRAWFEKIHAKMCELSSDGKLYTNYISMDKESTLEALFSNPLWEKFPGTMWAYQYKDMKLNVSTSYDYETGTYKMSIGVI